MSIVYNPVQTTPYSITYKVKSRVWGLINTTIFRWTPWFMRRTRIAMLKLFGAHVEWDCSISGGADIVDPWNLTMGHLSSIDKECSIRCRGNVTIGEKCCVSRGVDILTGSHNIFSMNFELETSPVVIEDNVWIATKAIIGKGVTIGKGAVVSSGAIVTRDVPMYAVVDGNPATISAFRYKLSDMLEIDPWLNKPCEARFAQIERAYNQLYGVPSKENQANASRSFTLDTYKDVFSNALGVEIANVEELAYKQSPEWDSVGHMSIVVALERTFGISFAPDDFMQLRSYADGIMILKKYGIELDAKKDVVFPQEFFDFSVFNNRIAVQTATKSYSYKELEEKSVELGHIIKDRKIVFLLARNTIGSIACYTACIKNRIPVAVLDAHKDIDFINSIIKQYNPQYLILPTEYKDMYSGVELGSLYDYSIKYLQDTDYDIKDDLALLLTTSGSTGSPKFVRLTVANIQSNAESIARYLELNERERPITSLPMYYSYGISIINSHFAVGSTLILTEESVVSSGFWSLAKEYGATSVSGVPYTYDMFRQMHVMDMDIPSLKTFTQAGGKMNKENVSFFAEKCKQKGRKLIVMYGQTEASPRISYLPFDKAVEKSESIGIAIPGVKLSLSDDGELVCEGDNVFQGYAETWRDLAKGDEFHGVLHTGDMARVDDDGYFYIIGRKKRFVKVYGNRVGLDELEQLVMSKFGKVVCVGLDDHVTIYTESKVVDLNDMLTYVSEKTKINQLAFTARQIDSFPYSETGKIQYKELEVIK